MIATISTTGELVAFRAVELAVDDDAENDTQDQGDDQGDNLLQEGQAEEEGEPTEAENPILPALNELIYAILAFVILLALMFKFAFPAVRKAMEARSDRIRNDLDEAERTRTEASTILADYQRQLADARAESGRIIESARAEAESMRRDLLARAERDAAETRERALADIQAQAERIRADLQQQVGALSIELAEKVVQRNLDRPTNMALIEDYIRQVESQRAPAGGRR